MDAFAEVLASAMRDAAVKSFVVLAGAGVVAFMLRRRSAAARHLVWTFALSGLLFLPVLSLFAPRWHWPITQSVLTTPAPLVEETSREIAADTKTSLPANASMSASALPIAVFDAPTNSTPARFHVAGQTQPAIHERLDLVSSTPVPWLAGFLPMLVPLFAGFVSLYFLRQRSHSVKHRDAIDVLSELRRELKIKRNVALLECTHRSIPMTWGMLRPVILLPEGATNWTRARLRMVLLHELVHIQRWDCLWQLVAQFVRAAYWFNPLVWLAVWMVKDEQEKACDDAVLNCGCHAADYAEQLLSVCVGATKTMFVAPVALAMSRFRRLERRVQCILDSSLDRRPVCAMRVRPMLLLGVSFLIALASFTFNARSIAADNGDLLANTDVDDRNAAQDDASTLKQVRELVKQNYVHRLDEQELTRAAIRGMIDSLRDPYSAYLDPEQVNAMDFHVTGNISGIGAHLQKRDGHIVVVTPLEESPALKAGIRAGDVITAVDGQPIKDLEIGEVVKRILGRSGSTVKLTIRKKDNKNEVLNITRGRIELRTIYGIERGPDSKWSFWLDRENKIGYMRIAQFSATTTADARLTLKTLQDQGMKGLVLDLRFCPGGILRSAIDVANLFLSQGTIVTIKYSDKKDQRFEANAKNTLGDFPVIVIVNEYTASAAEILAGALGQNNRAILLGTRTYGKGSVQSLIKLDGNAGALRLTTASFLLPGGTEIQKRPGHKQWGVDPSDGYFLPLTNKQNEALQASQREREILKPDADPRAKETPALESAARDHADAQLAAAWRSMTARLDKGQFLKVGKSQSALAAGILQREKIKEVRESLIKSLDKANQDLADLEKLIQDESPKADKN